VKVRPTLAWGKLRVSYRLLGSRRAFALHDWIVSRRLEKLAGQIDIIHTWPQGALRTLRIAARLGIPTVMERPGAHIRFVYEATQREHERLGLPWARGEEYKPSQEVLDIEEEEMRLADYLLCPSDFALKTFADQGLPKEKLVRHQYGYDETIHYPDSRPRNSDGGLTMLFVGYSGLIKGLHYALEAWLQSPAHRTGRFLVVGTFTPEYARKFSSLLAHPSISVLGRRTDVPDLMRKSDILVLPSIAEGSALVTSEARGCGCVLLVSDGAGASCAHMEEGLVHHAGDTHALAQHITMLHEDRALLERLRAASLRTVPEITWTAAGVKLLQVYREIIAARSAGMLSETDRTPAALSLKSW
jgi:glycosyltransferase involved in cell wall biosynthesis